MSRSRHIEGTIAPIAIVVVLVCLVGGAGAAAAFESDTVGSFWDGLWWAICLMTTVGYLHGPPTSEVGSVVSVVLILVGFVLLSLLSATLAALFIRSDAKPVEQEASRFEAELLARLDAIERRLASRERPDGD